MREYAEKVLEGYQSLPRGSRVLLAVVALVLALLAGYSNVFG